MNEYDIVIVKRDLSATDKAGCIGIVLMVFAALCEGYIIEFFDGSNDSIAVLTVVPVDIAVQDRA